MRKARLIFIGLLLLFKIDCFAQYGNETITITTYYPSPYGVYKNLELFPSLEPTGPTVKKGVMFFNETSNEIMVHNGTRFVPIRGSGGGGAGDILINAAHTKEDCRNVNGVPADSGTSFQICRVPGGECPPGWHQYENWGTYIQVTGCCYGAAVYCVYPRYAFGSPYGLNATSWSNFRPCGYPGGYHCSLSIGWREDGSLVCSPATEIGCY